MDKKDYQKIIDEFEMHYDYDCSYMRELLETSLAGFEKFNHFLALSSHQEKLTNNEYWIAKLAAMQVEDCGECLQLNVKMALESGVDKSLLNAILNENINNIDLDKDIYDYSRCVAENGIVTDDLMQRMSEKYSKGALLEFGLCIATAKVFPTIKRALGYTKSCSMLALTV